MSAPWSQPAHLPSVQSPSTPVLRLLSALLVATLLFSALLPGASAAPRAAQVKSLPLLAPQQQPSATWTICAAGCDFELIEEAVDDAGVVHGDTLLVMDAEHTESNILVDKNVTIRGQGAQNTIVQARSTPPTPADLDSYVFTISAGTRATIADMRVRHGSLFGWQAGTAISVSDREDGDASAGAFAGGWIDFRGGGITVHGDLTLDNAIVSDNYTIITNTMRALAHATAPVTATAEARAMAISNLQARGAGIFNTGNLTVTNSTIADNQIYAGGMSDAGAEASGGVITETAGASTQGLAYGAGIYNAGSMWLTNSTVSGNTAHVVSTAQATDEVDIPVSAPAHSQEEDLDVYSATGERRAFVIAQWDQEGRRVLTGSDEPHSPSLPAWAARLAITPRLAEDVTTITATINSEAVAGIYNEGTATITFSTISANSAIVETTATAAVTTVYSNTIGGLYNGPVGDLTLSNTIVAAQAQGGDCGATSGTSAGYNLDSDGSCGLAGIGDHSGVDPLLAALARNGGETPTHALLHGSPAVDAADPACPTGAVTTDQRGVARAVDGDAVDGPRCDIGAFEAIFEADIWLDGAVVGQSQVDGQPGHMFAVRPGAVTAGGRLTYTIAVHNDGPYAAGSVLLEQTVPVELLAEGATIDASQGSCDAQLPADPGVALQCALGQIAAGETATVTVGARTAPSIPDGTTLRSEATVSSSTPDPQVVNEVLVLQADVSRAADVRIVKTQAPAVALPGQALIYTLVVENLGPSDAATVMVSDVLPEALGEASWTCSASGAATCGESSGSGDLQQQGEIAAGAALTYTIHTALGVCAAVENEAIISAKYDPYALNDSDAVRNLASCLYVPTFGW